MRVLGEVKDLTAFEKQQNEKVVIKMKTLLKKLFPSKTVEENQDVLAELEKATQKHISEINRQCAMLDELNNKMMNWNK